jgi:hypothetical protein
MIAIFFAVLFCALVIALYRKDRSSVKFHLRSMESLSAGPFGPPENLSEALSWKTIRWFVQGRQSLAQFMSALREHQNALVTLNYYETRPVRVPATSDARNWRLLYPALTNTLVANTRYAITFDRQRPFELKITARPVDIDDFERVLRSESGRQYKPSLRFFVLSAQKIAESSH